jgi:hypothetical protein
VSRSRRKSPVSSWTTAMSEKWFKQSENQAKRRGVRVAIENGREPPPEKAFGNPWSGPKDGKYWMKKPTKKDMRK